MRRASQVGRELNGAVRVLLPGLAGVAPAPALAQAEAFLPFRADWLNAGAMSLMLVGLVVFATTTSILYVRERSRWARREGELAAGLEATRGHQERLGALLASDRQVVLSWDGPKASPVLEGDSGFLGTGGSAPALAYGTWRRRPMRSGSSSPQRLSRSMARPSPSPSGPRPGAMSTPKAVPSPAAP